MAWLVAAGFQAEEHTVVLGGDAARTGYLFESRVAAIYRVLGARVEQDVVLAGNQIDRGTSGKPPVFGMAQRKADTTTGKIVAKVVPDAAAKTLISHIQKRVLLQSTVYMDEWKAYDHLGEKGFQHSRVNHSQTVYVSGDAPTQTIEGFWSLLKRGIDGVYHSVSDKYLQSYLDEYAFRYSNRGAGGAWHLHCDACSGREGFDLEAFSFPARLTASKNESREGMGISSPAAVL